VSRELHDYTHLTDLCVTEPAIYCY